MLQPWEQDALSFFMRKYFPLSPVQRESRVNPFNYQLFQAPLGQENRYIGSNPCEMTGEFLPNFLV